MRNAYGGPAVDLAALERAGVDLPVLVSATVPLARRGSGKWHVVRPCEERWHGCHHAQDLETATSMPFLATQADVCAKCSPVAALPEAVRGLWEAATAIVAADGRARALAASTGPRTWPGYARALAEAAHHDDDSVRALLKPWLDDAEVGDQAWTALRAWTACVERSNLALAAYQAAAPAADTTAAVSRACDMVEQDRSVFATSNALDAALGRERRYYCDHVSLWPLVRTAWSAARRQGRDPQDALDFTLTMAAKTWKRTRVRDVTVLPDPPLVPVGDFPTPAAWGDAVLQAWWRQTVTAWCTLLETALAPSAMGSDERVLLLVRDWPLTRHGDEELAYLAQFAQVGPAVPDHLAADPRDPYHREPRYAVVLSAPRYAVDHALEHARHQLGRITAGEAVAGAGEATEHSPSAGPDPAALALLRTAYPYLPLDAAADGPAAEPTAAVRAARAAERAARGNQEQLHWADKRQEESRWDWIRAFTDGVWTWVPDDTGDGPACQQLTTLLPHCRGWEPLRLHVESGPADAPAVHTLFGNPEDWDPRRGVLRFRPVDGHRALAVAQHRIIGLSGVRYRRGAGQAGLWEDYRPPAARRAW
ncbi:hypothetical protein [Kitasatospora sp. MBT66]|uniref:hypothetical protein n=1 Tax=Kitasatospora sp. MBT66 TaxID=1444769 RepID=UPI0005B9EF38|nr:hypothetical protein [Kitasatospora sp. MBT66]